MQDKVTLEKNLMQINLENISDENHYGLIEIQSIILKIKSKKAPVISDLS